MREIEVRSGRFGTGANGLLEIPERRTGITLAQIGAPPDQTGDCEVGLSANQLGGSAERILVAADADIQIGKSQDKKRLLRIRLHGCLEHGDALMWATEPVVQGSKEKDRGEVVRSVLDGRLKMGDCLLVFPVSHEHARQPEPGRQIFRITFQRPREGGRGLSLLTVRCVQPAEQRVESRVPGAAA